MKKKKNRTLKLTGQTVRNLAPSTMSGVAGAGSDINCTFTCFGCGGMHTPVSEYPATFGC